MISMWKSKTASHVAQVQELTSECLYKPKFHWVDDGIADLSLADIADLFKLPCSSPQGLDGPKGLRAAAARTSAQCQTKQLAGVLAPSGPAPDVDLPAERQRKKAGAEYTLRRVPAKHWHGRRKKVGQAREHSASVRTTSKAKVAQQISNTCP